MTALVQDRLDRVATAFTGRWRQGEFLPLSPLWTIDGVASAIGTIEVGIVPMDHTWILETFACRVLSGVTLVSHVLRSNGRMVRSWQCAPDGIVGQYPTMARTIEDVPDDVIVFKPGALITLDSSIVALLGLHMGEVYFQFRDHDHRRYRAYHT